MTRARDLSNDEANGGGATPPFVAGKNAIINGNFDVWQRGISFSLAAGGATTSRYTVDRWSYGGEANFTISRQTAVNAGSSYALRMQRNSGATVTGDQFLCYVVESSTAQMFAGKTATLSFYMRKGADYSGSTSYNLLRTGTGTDEGVAAMYASSWAGYVQTIRTQVPTTTSTKYSFTFTIPSNVKELGFLIGYAGASGTAGANDWIEYEQMQFEIGDVATPFARAGGSIGGELALCQRYYYRQTASQVYSPFSNWASAYTTAIVDSWLINFPVTMRVPQTSGGSLTTSNIMITDGNTIYSTGTFNLATSSQSVWGAAVRYQHGTAALTQYRTYQINANNNAAAFIEFSAEL
jgi:hypothetical protein